uniref:Uncharacterized protein n=1 Tax=Arundo donax TaxID=35708 RepID=A0A0A9F498_ARUDO
MRRNLSGDPSNGIQKPSFSLMLKERKTKGTRRTKVRIWAVVKPWLRKPSMRALRAFSTLQLSMRASWDTRSAMSALERPRAGPVRKASTASALEGDLQWVLAGLRGLLLGEAAGGDEVVLDGEVGRRGGGGGG